MTTGQRIKEARKRAGITQTELGALLGVSGSMIAQYETDKRNPKQETIQRIADALECDFYWLLLGVKLSERERIVTNTIRIFNLQDEWDRKIVDVTTKRMEYELSIMGYSFSEKEQRLIAAFSKMDNEGQEKAADYVEDILPRYSRQDPAQPLPEAPAEASPVQDTPAAQDAPEGNEKPE